MNTTIIFAHPYQQSYNKAILDKVVQTLTTNKHDYTIIDLYKDDFNPILTEEELSVYNQGKSLDPLVEKYNAILDQTEQIILIFPIWWYDMPAIMRGFFDKVMLTGSAYYEDDKGIHPLRNIGKTVLFTTSSAPTAQLISDFGDPINKVIIAGTFKAIGWQNAQWYNLGLIGTISDTEGKAFLDNIPTKIL